MATPPTSSSRLALLTKYSTAVSVFTSSSSNFRIIHSISPTTSPTTTTQSVSQPAAAAAAKRLNLYILDSSFNPPTLAHLRLASSALLSDSPPTSATATATSTPVRKRLLLLLATQNADKPAQPAAPEHRLAMMTILARELLSQVQAEGQTQTWTSSGPSPPNSTSQQQQPPQPTIEGIDIGLTTCPYFVDKSSAISQSSSYPPHTTQVHLTGYDTFVRMVDAKYYPSGHKLASMRALLEEHRLRVAYRTGEGAGWGGRDEQEAFLREIAEGRREEEEGMRREWVLNGRVVLVEGRGEDEEVVSSTRVREAVRKGDRELLRRLVPEGVGEWILDEGLYLTQ